MARRLSAPPSCRFAERGSRVRRAASLLALLLSMSSFAAPPIAADSSDEELMLLSVRLDSDTVAESMPSYVGSDGVKVRRAGPAGGLGSGTPVRAEDGIAEGWAISENRRFLLHLSSATMSFDGNPTSFAATDVVRRDGDLYVDLRLLS